MNNKGNILVVDDSHESLALITEILTEAGYTVNAADSGELALTSLENNMPDLFLLDVRMPGIGGFDVCKKIKSNTQLMNIPIIFLTALTEKEDRVKGLELGAVDYISKPFEKEELLARVKTHLNLYTFNKLFKEQTAEQLIKNEKLLSLQNAELRILNEQLRESYREIQNSNEEYQVVNEELSQTNKQLITAKKKAEESDIKFRTITNQSYDGICLTDLDGNYMYVNSAFCEMTGYSETELLTMSVFDLSASTTQTSTFIDCKTTKSGIPFEVKLRHRGGNNFLAEIVGSTIKINQHDFVLGTIRNITHRKQAEEELLKSKTLIEGILNAIPVRIFWKDRNLTYLGCNPAFAHDAGFSDPKDLIGKDDYQMGWHEQAELYRSDDKQVIISEIAKLHIEEQQTTPEGNTITLLTSKVPLRNTMGEVDGVIGSYMDITDRKRTEEALRISQKEYRSVVDNIKEIIFQTDANGLWLFLNKSWEEITGFKLDESLGHLFLDFVHPDDRQRNMELFEPLVTRKKEYCRHEIRYLTKDGGFKWVEVFARLAINEKDEVIGTFGTLMDITESKQAEEALIKSESHFHALVEGLPGIVYSYAERQGGIYYSSRVKEILGYLPEYLYEHPMLWHDSIHPDDRLHVDEIIGQLPSGKSFIIEYRIADVQGNWHWFSDRLIEQTNDIGSRIITGLAIEITERKQVEGKLQLSEEKFRMAFVTNPETVAFTRLEDGIFVLINTGFTNLLGYTAKEIIGKSSGDVNLWEIPGDRQRLVEGLKADGIVMNLETVFRAKNGELKNALMSASIIILEGVEHVLSITRDITDRKQIELKLIKLQTAIESSKVSIFITDFDGNIEYANPYFTENTGFTPEDYLGKNPKILKTELHDKTYYQNFWNTIKSGQPWEGEFCNRKKNGDIFWERAAISPIVNNSNEITHFVAVKIDITETKKIADALLIAKEHAEESDRLKSAFLSNMSHEIRTPMNGILGFAGLLKEPGLSGEEQQKYIRIIEKGGARMLNIINNIVSISKIESGTMEMSYKESNINEAIEYIYTFFKPEIEAKGIKFSFKNTLSAKKATIRTDLEKLYAILTNLVNNAVKYTNKGSIEFGYIKKGDYLEFYVTDTGFGIPKDRQVAIFERFIQSDIEDKMARQGAGLGLSIARAYVEMLCGKIWVDSEVGIGSTFYFTIPFVNGLKEKGSIKDTDPFDGAAILDNPTTLRLKILIAEDDEASEMLITIAVKRICKDIIITRTGIEVVDICRNNPDIDLILMDIQMPSLNGYEATRQIRQFNKDVIIIAETAFGLTGDREKAITAGCNDYIAKPINKYELLVLIQKYFKK